MRLVAVAVLALAVAAPAGAAGFPRATFTATLSGKSPRFLNGAWRLTFLASGRYTTEHPLNEVGARGRIVVSGSTVTFKGESGPLACPPGTAGRYRWSYSGGRLRLTAVTDACGGRKIVLTAKPFRLVAG
jgi:hypothetical protein